MRKHKRPLADRRHRPQGEPSGSSGSAEVWYRVERSELLGRYLVAARDVPAGAVVLSEEPLVVGPCQEAKPLCLGCYVDIDLGDALSYERCGRCGWPLCSSGCGGLHRAGGHSEEECDVLSRSGSVGKAIGEFEGLYYAVAPLRCLVKRERSPEAWGVLRAMESHTEQRKQSDALWAANEKMAVEVIRNALGLTQFSAEEIHFICGVLEVNAFEVSTKAGMQSLRAVYPNAFLFAHDCVPNTCRSNDSDFRLTVRATTAIPAGAAITVSYAYTLQCTLLRRRHLRHTKFFACRCRRCSDPTELGTYTGAIRCSGCPDGFLLPQDPLDDSSPWKCASRKCSRLLQASQIAPLLDRLFEELDSIGGNDVEGYEAFVRKCGATFHEQHYLALSAMHCLSQLYGKVDGYLINDLTDAQLQRKEEICRRLLRVFDRLEPGQSKQRGLLLYELQAPMMVLLRRRLQGMPRKELRARLRAVVRCLEEAFLILSKEPASSVEGEMAGAAKEAISGLQEWLNALN